MKKAEKRDTLSSNLRTVKSKTVVVDKKNSKFGHFSKLKKKNQEEFNKFLDQRSKEIDINQLKSAIEKVQAKIGELGHAIESKTSIINHQPEAVNASRSQIARAKTEPNLKSSEVFKAAAFAGFLMFMIFLILYFIEGKRFFISAWLPGSLNLRFKTAKPKSWIDVFFN